MRLVGILAAFALAMPSALAAQIIDLQCVPFARSESGIQIYGDAWTWWGQAEGRYRRGPRPAKGAVMAFRPHGNSKYGHVAVVAKLVSDREVLLNHANWSPINGRRGQIERGVRAVDVSENGDWSKVRVWYDPIQELGVKHFPLYGFIYPDGIKLPKEKDEPQVNAVGTNKSKDKKGKLPVSLLPGNMVFKSSKAGKGQERGKGTGLPGIADYLNR